MEDNDNDSSSMQQNEHHHSHNKQVFNLPPKVLSKTGSEFFDDDGRIKRTGTIWTATAHIITAVIGSGVLSLPWAVAELGWVAGPIVMVLFSIVTYYTSVLLADCYRSGDPVNGKRNYTYMDAVRANLGGMQVTMCGWIQYLNLYGSAISYTIAASISMMAIKRSNCFHASGGKDPCRISANPYMIIFGITEIIVSQIPNFDQISWLSIVAAVMSFTYSLIGLGLSIAKIAENKMFGGTLTGISIGTVTQTQKTWRTFQALGDIAFAYSYSMVLIEIQDTIKCPPTESKTMRKATVISVSVTTIFYMLCGCMGYAAFGDLAPGNVLTGFGFYNPYWLLDIANASLVIHLVGSYQVYAQPLFAFIEKFAAKRFPDCKFITKEVKVPIPGRSKPYNLNLFRLVWRTLFVISTTVISMLLPFFNDAVAFIGAIGFWPLTVYYPVEMYIKQKNIAKCSTKWLLLEIVSGVCLVVSLVAAAGSVAGMVDDLKSFKPFGIFY